MQKLIAVIATLVLVLGMSITANAEHRDRGVDTDNDGIVDTFTPIRHPDITLSARVVCGSITVTGIRLRAGATFTVVVTSGRQVVDSATLTKDAPSSTFSGLADRTAFQAALKTANRYGALVGGYGSHPFRTRCT